MQLRQLLCGFAALVFSGGCATEDVGSGASSLEETRHAGPFESRGLPALVAYWTVPKAGATPASEALTLHVENTSDYDAEVVASVEMVGLRRERRTGLEGASVLRAHEAADYRWVPAESPLKPIGTSIELAGRVSYRLAVPTVDGTSEVVEGTSSSEHVYLSFAEGFTDVFASADDDLGVRLASLSTTSSANAVAADAPMSGRIAAVMKARDELRGLADGAEPLNNLALEQNPHSDSLRLDPTWAKALDQAESNAQPNEAIDTNVRPLDTIDEQFPNCAPSHMYPGFRNVCVEWRSALMYNDSAVSSSVAQEDQLSSNVRAPYVLAEIWAGGTRTWFGHLDWAGCTGWGKTGAGVPVCMNQVGQPVASVKVQPGSIWRDSGGDGTSVVLGVRPFVTYSATPYSSDSSFIFARVEAQDRWTRAAAVATTALTRTDLGMLNPGYAISLNVAGGLVSYSDPNGYHEPGEPLLGEASGSLEAATNLSTFPANEFGRPTFEIVLGRSTTDHGVGASPRYTALPQHTTQSKFTIAHEVGHTIQGLNDGWPNGDYYTDRLSSGPCSCTYVTVGNTFHCLGSRHLYSDSNIEGFGHFFAARVLNDPAPGADCRFTYYKTHINSITVGGTFTTTPPPAPVDCATPFQVGTNPTTSWMRNFCNSSGPQVRSTERDWLTFLWRINGGAPTASKVPFMSLMPLFRRINPSDPASTLNWTLVQGRAFSNLPTAQYNLVSAQALVNGLR